MQETNSIEATIMVLEDFLKKQRRAISLPYRINNVSQAIALMEKYRGNISCKKLQALTNTSRKTLERAFMTFHGLYPKSYIRIIRFNFSKQMMESNFKTDLTKLACHLGYFDQSHFRKDFKTFSGQTPTEYLKSIEEENRKRTIPVN